jgi:hypothetical protein
MIHLGQLKGRKNHPENPKEKHDPSDFAIAEVDDKGNVTEVVEEATSMPSTERRQEAEAGDIGQLQSLSREKVEEYIQGLRDQGLDKQADRAEKMLLG